MKTTLLYILLCLPFVLQAQITMRACLTPLGDQDYILNNTGMTNDGGTVRNTFESSPSNFAQSCGVGVCEIRIIWSITNSRWEIQLDNDGPIGAPDYTNATLYFNTTASTPNPPDLSLGTWRDATGSCGGDGTVTSFTGDVQNQLSGGGGAVPIELSYFEAKAQAHQVILEWQTAAEYNNDYFLLEHSMNGQDFKLISRVEGQGFSNENKNYKYTSNIIQHGVNYYRLQQVDFDNSSTFSKVVAVEYEQKGMEVQLFPLPVLDKMNVILQADEKKDGQFQIFDAMGKVVRSGALSLKGNNSQIDLSNLGKGFYYIQFKIEEEKFTQKFSKH